MKKNTIALLSALLSCLVGFQSVQAMDWNELTPIQKLIQNNPKKTNWGISLGAIGAVTLLLPERFPIKLNNILAACLISGAVGVGIGMLCHTPVNDQGHGYLANLLLRTPKDLLLEALYTNNIKQAESMLRNNSIITKDNIDYLLLRAIQMDLSKEVVQLCLEHVEDVNTQDEWGTTPLYWASFLNRSQDMIGLLLEHGADETIADNRNTTPCDSVGGRFITDWCTEHTVEVAYEKGYFNVVRKLLQRDPTQLITSADECGCTLLHHACGDNNSEAVKYLIETDSFDINEQDECGYTPLHHACIPMNNEIIAALLKHSDINVNIQNNDGYTPLHALVSMRNRDPEQHQKAVTLLLNAGAKPELTTGDDQTACDLDTHGYIAAWQEENNK